MKLNSHNEWDRLREVIVGNADTSIIPIIIYPGRYISDSERNTLLDIAHKAFPDYFIDEVNEDLELLCTILKKNDIKVHRPGGYSPEKFFETPYFIATCGNLYNVRDLNIIVGNTIIEGPSPDRNRIFESYSVYDIFYQYIKEGCKWICSPKPKLHKNYTTIIRNSNGAFDSIKLKEDEILFDTANIIRMGKDLLYLVSNTGNYSGSKWLQNVLGDDYNIHTVEGIYKWSHIDTTIICLRPGLVLFNGERVNENNYPEIFKKWDKIFFNDIIEYSCEEIEFHNNIIKPLARKMYNYGVETNISMSSHWIGMNLLSLDDKTVLVDERQIPLIKILKKYNIESIPIRMKHSSIMRGGIHCCTLDTVRDGKLENYFSKKNTG